MIMYDCVRDRNGILPRHEGRYSGWPDGVVYGAGTPKKYPFVGIA